MATNQPPNVFYGYSAFHITNDDGNDLNFIDYEWNEYPIFEDFEGYPLTIE